jgi:hypothetical protein
VVLSSMASPDAGEAVFVAESPDSVELAFTHAALLIRSTERPTRETRGPPARS